MGDEGAGAAAEADVSAAGTLVWVRRPNGSWWPGRVVSPDEVPDTCPAPPRTPAATPILLLGRRDGAVFVDWFNLERSKRVKPFRCGEAGLEDCIRRAEEQEARHRGGRRDQRVRATGARAGSRYARKEDAVLQALDIERARLRSSTPTSTTTTTTKPSHPAAVADAQPSACPSGRRKRRTPNDSEDDAPQRMKDLTDISAPPKQTTPNAATTFADLNRHPPSTSQMKRSKQSHHGSPGRKRRPSADQDQPCGVSRKRDRSRPLSELCNGDLWKNGFTPNGQTTGPSLDTSLDTKSSSSRRAVGPVKTEPVDAKFSSRRAVGPVQTEPVDTKYSSRRAAVGPVKAEPVDDEFPRWDVGPVDANLAARSIFKSDHLHVQQPCASTKAPTLEFTKRASNYGKDGISSQCDSRNSKKKITSSVDHEGGNRTKNASERENHRERAAKRKAPSTEVVLLKKRVEKSTTEKTAASDNYNDLAVIPNGLAAKHKASSTEVVLLKKRVEKSTADKTAASDNYNDLAVIPNRLAAKHKAPSTEVVLLKKRVEKSTADKTAASDDYNDHAVIPNGLAAKHKAPSTGDVLLKKRVEKSTANKTAASDDYNDLAVIPNGLDRVGAVLQQHSDSKCKHEAVLQQYSESKCKHEEPSETISNNLADREEVPAPSMVFKLPPHQVLPPQQRDLVAARCHAVKPVKTLQLNSSLYDVEISVQGASSSSSSKGGRVPLVSLMSKSSRRPVVGYPVSVEVLDVVAPRPPAPSINDHPSTSNSANRVLRVPKVEQEEAAAAPQRAAPPPSSSQRAARVTRTKAKSRRKASSEDESWRPHTKNSNPAAAASSPRKMRRLSSLAPSQRGGGGGDRRAVAGELCRVRVPPLACVPLRLVFSRIHEALSYSGK